MALQNTIDRRHAFTLPLKSHGYLLEILIGLADKAERRREEQYRQRPHTHETEGCRIADIQSERRHFEGLFPACPRKARKGMEEQVERLKAEPKTRRHQIDSLFDCLINCRA